MTTVVVLVHDGFYGCGTGAGVSNRRFLEVLESRVVPAAEIDEQFARDEGEGFESVDDWREAHERFFGRPIEPETQIVAVRFRVVEEL